jgi:hypothetical protein
MILVVKLLFVAFAVFGQAKLFQEKPAPAEVSGDLDTLVLPVDKPELVLAKRAMEAQGLCHTGLGQVEPTASGSGAEAQAEVEAHDAADARGGLANNCF